MRMLNVGFFDIRGRIRYANSAHERQVRRHFFDGRIVEPALCGLSV